jgi:hypothetical protein
MVDKTPMTANAPPHGQPTTSSRRGGLAYDILSLVELQWKLFSADCKEGLFRLALAGISLVASLLVLIASIPLFLAAFAQMLLVVAGMPLGWALLLTAVLGIVMAAGAAVTGFWLLRRAGRAFRRSGREFTRNLEWIKDALKSSANCPEKPEARNNA